MAAGPPTVDMIADEGDRIVVEIRLNGYETRPVEIDGRRWVELELPGEPVSLAKGAPALPHVNRSLIVPDAGRIEARVLEADSGDFDLRVAPSKGNLSRSVSPRDVPYWFGPVYDTESKRPYGPPQGIEKLTMALEAASVPLVAIGGINPGRAREIRGKGASALAVISYILDSADPECAARDLGGRD